MTVVKENDTFIGKQTHSLLTTDIKGLDSLAELALDLRWSWSHASDDVWREIDPELWKQTSNPWVFLKTISVEKLKAKMAEPEFSKFVEGLVQEKKLNDESPAWFQETYPKSALKCAAYFSMEFMLSESLPIYSGGLGNVAGDQLKAASDLGVPVVGIGLLYQQGYFRQMIDKDGIQQALYPYNDPGQLPVTPLRKPNGEWLRLEVNFPGWTLWIRAWQVNVGRVKLYLLDSNDPANLPFYRGITSELYGGGSELRLRQELILGIGGWRLLEALGIQPDVCHLNEGHAAFAVLERARSFMRDAGVPFKVALEATRAGNLFTTHTAVPAGFDQFSPSLIEQYMTFYATERLKISMHDLLALGRLNPDNDQENFNMAYLAIHGSGAVNGVSRLHGKVSREIFASLFPRWPLNEVPVHYVTNGVHMPSWDSAAADDLWTNTCGKRRWLGVTENLEKEIQNMPNEKIWHMRNLGRKNLVEYARERLSRQIAGRGGSLADIEMAKHLFDPNTLTLGFARRFATYKRPNMLLHNPERLLRILSNQQRPVQLFLAGKAHPADKPGQELIRQWIQFIWRPDVRSHVIFLEDYDMRLTEHLVSGVDVWINTPKRPWEACGTSGMKVLVNGGLNLSELDGWWAEAYTPEVGWAIGDGKEHGDDPVWDAAEADNIYNLLEQKIIPEFYNRNAEGIPATWVNRIRNSMALLTPRYSANRAVREYTESHYLKAAEAYKERAKDQGAVAKNILEWQKQLKDKWSRLRFENVSVETSDNHYKFDVSVYLDDLNINYVKVELYSDGVEEGKQIRQEMTLVRPLASGDNTYLFSAKVPANRPAGAYTSRVVPFFKGVPVPLEASEILWQK